MRTAEIISDESGEFDVVWLEGDNLRVFEQGKQYYVRSVGDLSNPELSDLIDKSKNYILMTYSVQCPEHVRKGSDKSI